MARYIDADLLLQAIEEETPLNWTDSEAELQAQFDYRVFKHIVDYQPTADVAKVRRGRWLPQRLLGEDIVDCSECNTIGSPHWKWCPVCGADMRGKKDE